MIQQMCANLFRPLVCLYTSDCYIVILLSHICICGQDLTCCPQATFRVGNRNSLIKIFRCEPSSRICPQCTATLGSPLSGMLPKQGGTNNQAPQIGGSSGMGTCKDICSIRITCCCSRSINMCVNISNSFYFLIYGNSCRYQYTRRFSQMLVISQPTI